MWQSFTGHAIDTLQDFADRLGFWPKLVFDRGFGNESIVEHLNAEGLRFYIGLKVERYVECDGQRTKIENVPAKNVAVQLFGLTLRVIRSPRSRRAKQLWYVLTDDQSNSRNKIVNIYYDHFEIEESFKDLKQILEFRRTRPNKPNSLKDYSLAHVSWHRVAVYSYQTKQTNHIHPKKRISWMRRGLERLYQP